MFSKILVPVDGSEISFRALEAALFLAKKLGSDITTIHITEDIPLTYIDSEKLLNNLTEISMACKSRGQEILTKCSEIAIKNELTINTVLLQGNPATIVVDYSENGKYDIVIMGSHGMGKFKKLILGSVSSKVIHHSSCPVMIIR